MMKPTILGIAAAALLVGTPAFAQTSSAPTTGTTTAPTTTAPAARSGAPNDHSATTGNVMPPGAPGNRSGQQAASGDTNQAVATTSANAPQPAHGANSFTMGQAKSRMEQQGFSDVTNLRKDDNGVWRAQAQKSGNPAQVWLDYKGNIGQGQTE